MIITIALILVSHFHALANDISSTENDFIPYLKAALVDFKSINKSKAQNYCNLEISSSEKVPISQKCLDTYKNFYKNDKIDMRIAIGYADSEDIKKPIFDLKVYNSITQQLTSTCKKGLSICGFQKKSEGIFVKIIKDPFGKDKEVTLRVSSPSTDKNVEAMFLDGIKKSDALFYIGHARGGGGPDFEKAKRLSNGKKDYDYYKTKRPGIKKLLSALQERKKHTSNPLPFLGLAACSSDKLFAAEIKKISPSSTLMTMSDTSTWLDDVGATMGALNSLLGQRCEVDFQNAVKRPRSNYRDTAILSNFFK